MSVFLNKVKRKYNVFFSNGVILRKMLANKKYFIFLNKLGNQVWFCLACAVNLALDIYFYSHLIANSCQYSHFGDIDYSLIKLNPFS